MSFFAVQYTYTDDAAGRDEHRAAHRDYLAQAGERASVALSGPYEGGVGQPDGALLLVEADSVDDVIAHLAEDPFQHHGLVERMEIRGWKPVLGAWQGALAEHL